MRLAIIGLGASLGPFDIAVNVALPAIADHFRLQLHDVQWLVVCYVLVYGSLMLVCGKLGDLFGYRRIFCIGLIASAIGCAACATAPSWSLFLLARALQGVGTAFALACAPALATSVYPSDQKLKALAGLSANMSFGAALAPLVGGALIDMWGWPAVYWVRIPAALLGLSLAGLLPAPRSELRPFDFKGGILVAGCMSTLLLSLVLLQRPAPAGWLAPGLFLAAFELLRRYIAHCHKAADPIIRPALFSDASFAVLNIMNVLAHLAGFAILLLTPFYLITVLRISVLASGVVLTFAFASAIAGAPVAARLVPRIGRRPVAFTGIAVVGLGLLPLALTGEATPVLLVALLLAIVGLGKGLLNVAYTDLVMNALPERDRGVAGALALLTRTLGVVSGASVLTALHGYADAGGFVAGYRFAFFAAGGGLLAALALSCLWWPRAWITRRS